MPLARRLLMTLALVPVVALAARQAPVTLKHSPPSSAVRDAELVLRANIVAAEGVYLPTLFYRAVGDTRYYSLPMLPVPGSIDIYAASVPGLFVNKDLEYYLESYDKKLAGPGRMGDPKKPLYVKVVAPSVPPSQVVVRSEPSGAEVVLDGESMGETPWGGVVDAGPHELLLKKEGFLEVISTILVPENRDLEVVRSLPLEAERALFAVSSDPVGAVVRIDGQVLGETPLIAPSPEGEHTLSLEKPGHARAERTLLFTKERSIETNFALVKLPPEPALAITTAPAGAKVIVDGQPLGTTPFLGVVPAGEHTVVLSLDGRRTAQAQIVMPEDRDLDLRFALADASLQREPVIAVSSEPAGARIFIDGVELPQTTPYLGTLAPGPHRIRVEADKHEPYERTITMPEGNDVEVTLALVPLPPPPGPSRVIIETEQPDVALTVNGKPQGRAPLTLSMDAGDHVVVARKDGFRAVEERFRVVQGEAMKFKLALSPVEKGVDLPLLSVRTDPEGATLTLDGQVLSEKTPFSRALPPGRHTLMVTKEGFKPREETFELPDDRAFELRFALTLEPVRRTVQLQSAVQALQPRPAGPLIDLRDVRSGSQATSRVAPVTDASSDVFGDAKARPAPVTRQLVYEPRGTKLPPLVLAGTGVVLAGVGGLFVMSARSTAQEMADTALAEDREAIVRRHDRAIIAGFGLTGVGVVMAALGAVWAARPDAPPPGALPVDAANQSAGTGGDGITSVGISGLEGGGLLTVGGRF